MADAAIDFSLQCTYCNGPIPFDIVEFNNNKLGCLVCEQPYEHGFAMAASIEQDFKIIKQIMLLLPQNDDRYQNQYPLEMKQHLEMVELKLSTLAVAIYSKCSKLSKCIQDLCEHYIEWNMLKKALDWYHWLVEIFDIYLPNIKQGDEDWPDVENDRFSLIYQLDQWTQTYLDYLSTNSFPESEDEKQEITNYVSDVEKIFNRLFDLLCEEEEEDEEEDNILSSDDNYVRLCLAT